MNTNQLQNEILSIIRMVFKDKRVLEKIHAFLMDEIYQEPEPEQMPDKYKKLVIEIADKLLAGLICFFNPDTFEIEYIPKDFADYPEEFEMMTGETCESSGLKHENWQNCITIDPMESHDSFQIMENFVDEVTEASLQKQLITALNKPKPFANFKFLIENSEYRQYWFDFRLKQCEYHVWDIIKEDNEIES